MKRCLGLSPFGGECVKTRDHDGDCMTWSGVSFCSRCPVVHFGRSFVQYAPHGVVHIRNCEATK